MLVLSGNVIRNRLSKRVKELRFESRMSLTECYYASGKKVSQATISRIEENKTEYNPTLGSLVEIAELFHISVAELLDGVHIPLSRK